MEIPNSTPLETEASNETTSPQRLRELSRTSLELAKRVAARTLRDASPRALFGGDVRNL